MAGIIEGPFRHIVAVPSAAGRQRGMIELLAPILPQFQAENDIRTFSPNSSVTEVDFSLDPYDPLENAPVLGTVGATTQNNAGAFTSVFFTMPSSVFSRLWLGLRVIVNGSPVRPLWFTWSVTGALANLQVGMPPHKMPAGAIVNLVWLVAEDSSRLVYQPQPTVIFLDNASPFEERKARAQAEFASYPSVLYWPYGDLSQSLTYAVTRNEFESAAPSYFNSTLWDGVVESITARGVLWAVGKISPRVAPLTGYTVRVDLVYDIGGGDLAPLVAASTKQNQLAGQPQLIGSALTATVTTADAIQGFRAFERAGKVVFEVTFDTGAEEEVAEFDPETRVTYPWRVRGSLNAADVFPEPGQASTNYAVSTTRYAEYPCLITGTVHLP